ncbi:MAG: hypothetical protein CMC08_03965 [Flavobacteriaceae bacterium]|nr:hypothetical protein [Flavobacteriaceae bacterium]
MARDIKKMIAEHGQGGPSLPDGHEARFEARLSAAFPTEGKNAEKSGLFLWMKVAAIGIVFVAVGAFGYYTLLAPAIPTENSVVTMPEPAADPITPGDGVSMSLADISPDLKKIEEFYLTGINVQLASLKVTKDNKDLIDGYMNRLAELDTEYKQLTSEMGELGPSEATISAMIDNLKLRLELLFKLKNKLKELKNQDYENVTTL